MRPRILQFTATTALVLGFSLATLPAIAQDSGDFEKGVAAFETQNYKEALELWQPLADDDNVDALVNLAQLYRLGLGVQRDDAKGFELYKRAAELGSADAQVNVAFQLVTGKGVEKDNFRAANWFEEAADQGDAMAQFNLGLMYERGVGVRQDEELAVDLYRLAAAQGQPRAIARLEARENEATAAEIEAAEATTEDDAAAKLAEAEKAAADAKAAADEEAAAIASGGPVLSIKPVAPKPLEFEGGQKSASNNDADKMPAYTPEADQNETGDDRPVFDVVRTPMRKPGDRIADAPKGNEPTRIFIDEAATENGDDDKSAEADAPTPAYVLTVNAESAGETGAEPAAIADDQMSDSKSAASLSTSQMRAPSDPVARVKMAESAYRSGNFADAIQLLNPLANAGMPIAQFWMGRMYNRGEGVELNRAEAYSLWRSASAGGSERAATALANLASRLSPDEISYAEQQHAASGRVR